MNPEVDYKAVLVDLEARRDALNVAISAIKQIMGQVDANIPSNVNSSNIPERAFFKMSVVDAASKYLGMVKGKQTAREIADALERGGITHSSKDFYQTVYALLRRRMKDEGDIVKNDDGTWGLAEWYPGMRSKRAKAKTTDSTNGDEAEVTGEAETSPASES